MGTQIEGPFYFLLKNWKSNLLIEGSDYWYYDTPDGHDPFKKLYFCLKYTVRYGIYIATADVFGFSQMEGALPAALRFFHVLTPYAILGATFPTVAYLSTKIREVDGPMNHAIAAAVTFFCIGLYKRNLHFGCHYAVPAVFVATNLKYFKQEMNYNYFPHHVLYPQQYIQSSFHVRHYKADYSLFEQRPKGWVRAEDVKQIS